MINQKLQDFEEEVKPLGDIMTQVNDSSRKNTIPGLLELVVRKVKSAILNLYFNQSPNLDNA